MPEFHDDLDIRLARLEEQFRILEASSANQEEKLKEIEEKVREVEKYFWLRKKQEIINKIKKNPENYLSTPYDLWQGLIDTIYLSGCYIHEFLDFLGKTMEEFLKKNSESSPELVDTQGNFNKFSFDPIFSKENYETTEVPCTGEYQCSLRNK